MTEQVVRQRQVSLRDPSSRRGDHRQRRFDLPLLRHQPPGVVQVAPAPRRSTAWTGSGTAPTGPRSVQRRPAPRSWARSSTCARTTIRPGRDRHVPPALPRRPDQPARGVAGPQRLVSTGCRPPSGTSVTTGAGSATRSPARPPGQIDVKFIAPLFGIGSRQQALPVHRHRRLHPPAGPAHLPPAQPEDGHPVCRLRAGTAAVPGRGHPDRQRRRVPAPLFHYHVLDKGMRLSRSPWNFGGGPELIRRRHPPWRV